MAAIALIDRLKADVVYDWLPADAAEKGRQDVEQGKVARPILRTKTIQAIVADRSGKGVRVTLSWGLDQPVARCECGRALKRPCRHAAALALFLVGEAVPLGADEDDEAVVEPAERERRIRRERGASELFEVKPHARTEVLGRYDVASPSSRTYQVDIRWLPENLEALLVTPGKAVRAVETNLLELRNGCTCADFDTNLLGTCKHIEAVLARLAGLSRAKIARALKQQGAANYLYIRRPEGRVAMFLGQPLAPAAMVIYARYFGSMGILRGDLAEVWEALGRDAEAAGVTIADEVRRLAVRAIAAAERARRAEAVREAVFRCGPEQPGFGTRLYPYQVEGVAFLASCGRAILADDMGLGKTAQAIAAMVRLMRTDHVRRTVVVCPTSLKHQWAAEIARFTQLPARRVVVVGGPKEQRRAQYRSQPEVLITSYELARLDQRDLEAAGADLLILDEAQRIKNWRTQTAVAIKGLRTKHAFVLTGTPVENRLDDLYSLMQVVDPHVLGPLWKFNEDFTRLDERGKAVGYHHLDELRERLAPVLLRRRKDDVLTQLPPQVVNRLLVPMTAKQQELHDDAEQAAVGLLGKLKKRPLTPAEEKRLMQAFQRMRMACDAAGLVDKQTEGAPKLDELEGLLDEICIQGGHKVVIFSEWEKMQAMAAKVCERMGIGHVCLNGGVPSDRRGPLIERFRSEPACQVFLSTDAGGVGLNLQVASHLINLDLPWNPAVLNQRIARVHRLGQPSSVNVVLLVSEGGFEDRMQLTLGAKTMLAAAATGDDTETTELDRTTMASKVATLLSGAFAAVTGPLPVAAESEPADGDSTASKGDATAPEDVLVRVPPAALGTLMKGSLTSEGSTGAEGYSGVDGFTGMDGSLGVDGFATSQPTPAQGGALQVSADGRVPASVAIAALKASLKDHLERVVVLPDGQLVGVLREGAPEPFDAPAVLLPRAAVEALGKLGGASPLAEAQILYLADPEPGDAALLAARRELLASAERKLTAGQTLLAAGLAGEGLGLLRQALSLACRALDDRGDPGEDPAALLAAVYGYLLPSGLLGEGDAHALARAGEVARAFAGTTAPPEALVAAIAQEARDLVARVRERLAPLGTPAKI